MNRKLIIHLQWVLSLVFVVLFVIDAIITGKKPSAGLYTFVAVLLVYVFASIKKKGLKISSAVSFLLSPIAVAFLLLNIIAVLVQPFSLMMTIASGLYFVFMLVTAIYFSFSRDKDNKYDAYARRECTIITSIYAFDFYLISLLSPSISSSSAADWGILIEAGIIVFSSLFVIYFTLSYAVTSFAESVLSLKEKIKRLGWFFVTYKIGFFFSEAFALGFATVSIINYQKEQYFQYMAFVYSILFFLRLFLFISEILLKRKVKNPVKLSKRRNVLLVINSSIILTFNMLFASALIYMIQHRLVSEMPWWIFVCFMFPFSIMNFIIAIIGKRKSKTEDNAINEATADLALLMSVYSFFCGCSYFGSFFKGNVTAIIIIFTVAFLIVLGQTAYFAVSLGHGIRGCIFKREIQLAQDYCPKK